MALHHVQVYEKTISCSICLDLLRNPVTTSCGHNYCMKCIKGHWDIEDEEQIYSCPQCRHTFTPRPVLMKNTMLADLVEQLKKTGLQAAPADHCYAGAEDVSCDVCTGRKLKASKSCLACLVSYCETHLQLHYESPAFVKHKLVEPSKNLQVCHTDVGHDSVSATAAKTEWKRELEGSRLKNQQRIQHSEDDVKLLQRTVDAVSCFADEAMEDREKIFTMLTCLLEHINHEVKQQIRSQQKSQMSGAKELQEKLELELSELKRTDAMLKLILNNADYNQFRLNYTSLSPLSPSTSSINIRPPCYFEDMMAAVSEVEVLLLQAEPKTRAEFLKYSRQISLDPNTVYMDLVLSEENRRVTVMDRYQSYPRHPDRFTRWPQVLSRESLTGRCYWEVEWRGDVGVDVAVSYKSISRDGGPTESLFGFNNKSWMLDCDPDRYVFWYNSMRTDVSGPPSSTVGVYLDHDAGILSFYSVSETMTLLHRVQTTFTEPLHAGLHLHSFFNGPSAEFFKLKSSDMMSEFSSMF